MNEKLIELAAQILTTLLLAGLGLLVKKWSGQKDAAFRLEMLQKGAALAFGVVNELARKSPTKIDDKVAKALGEVNLFLASQGQPPVAPEETMALQQMFDAQHASEKKLESLKNP